MILKVYLVFLLSFSKNDVVIKTLFDQNQNSMVILIATTFLKGLKRDTNITWLFMASPLLMKMSNYRSNDT